MNYYTSLTINLSFTLFPVIAGSLRFKLLDKASRIFLFLIAFSFVTECAAFSAALLWHNNLPVYNISNIIQQFLIALYFNYCIALFKKRNIGIYIAVISAVLGVLDLLFIDPITSFCSNFFLYQTVSVFIMGAVYFRQLMIPSYLKIQYNPHFWFVIVLTLFYVLTFFMFSVYDYFSKPGQHFVGVDDLILLSNAAANVLFAFVFFFYPKMRNGHGG